MPPETVEQSCATNKNDRHLTFFIISAITIHLPQAVLFMRFSEAAKM